MKKIKFNKILFVMLAFMLVNMVGVKVYAENLRTINVPVYYKDVDTGVLLNHYTGQFQVDLDLEWSQFSVPFRIYDLPTDYTYAEKYEVYSYNSSIPEDGTGTGMYAYVRYYSNVPESVANVYVVFYIKKDTEYREVTSFEAPEIRDLDPGDYDRTSRTSSIIVDFTADENADKHEIYVSTNNNDYDRVARITNMKSRYEYEIEDLKPGTRYYVGIKSYYNGQEKKSNMDSIVTPEGSVNLEEPEITDLNKGEYDKYSRKSSIIVEFRADEDADKHEIYISKDNYTFDKVETMSGGKSRYEYEIEDLQPGTKYYVGIKSYYDDSSEKSDIENQTTPESVSNEETDAIDYIRAEGSGVTSTTIKKSRNNIFNVVWSHNRKSDETYKLEAYLWYPDSNKNKTIDLYSNAANKISDDLYVCYAHQATHIQFKVTVYKDGQKVDNSTKYSEKYRLVEDSNYTANERCN